MVTVEAEYFIFCEQLSRTDGKVNLQGIFDGLTAPQFPMTFPPFRGQIKLRAKQAITHKDLKADITMLRGEQEIGTMHATLPNAIAEKHVSLYLDLNFEDLAFEEPGMYYFKVYIEGKPLITRSIRVRPVSDFVEP